MLELCEECPGIYGCAFQLTFWIYFQIADKFSCWYNFKYLNLEIRGKNLSSFIISYLCCYVCLLFYGFDVVLAERDLFPSYKKCEANCEVLQIHQTKHFGLWNFCFHEPITVCVCEKLILLYQSWYWYIYLSRIFCQTLQDWPPFM